MSNTIERNDPGPAAPIWKRAIQALKERAQSRLPSKEITTFVGFLVFGAILPAAVLVAIFFGVGWKVAEIGPPTDMARSQQKNPGLVLLPAGKVRQYAAYKLARIKELQPDIIYVGQSRCSQVRSEMFKPYAFYNACLTSWTLDQIREFIERTVAIAKPSIVIVELDYFMFTREYKALWTSNAAMDFEPNTFMTSINATLRLAKEKPLRLLKSLVAPKVAIDRASGFQLVGFDSINNRAGFRYDGSLLRRMWLTESGEGDAARQFVEAVHGGPGLDPGQLEALSKLAATASKFGVKLVGTQVPIYAPVVDYLDTDTKYHPYAGVWRAFESDETRRLLERLGIIFFDMARAPANREPRHFTDPAHPSELGILYGLLAISSDPRFKSAFPLIDPERIRSDYEELVRHDRIHDIYAGRS